MDKFEKGFVGGFIAYAIFCVLLTVAIIYVALHFILKAW